MDQLTSSVDQQKSSNDFTIHLLTGLYEGDILETSQPQTEGRITNRLSYRDAN